MNSQKFTTFTSESVSEGHPDKIADQISDAVLDAFLSLDKCARVACETYVKTGMVIVGGEITSCACVDIETTVRELVKKIGYTDSKIGFDYRSCAVINVIGRQSLDISKGVDRDRPCQQGAGDQGIVFGYACDETEELMPAPISYAHKIMKRQADVRRNCIPWLLPDAKSQVTVEYDENLNPISIPTIVVSTQHEEHVCLKVLKEAVIEEIIKPVIPKRLLKNTIYHINPAGKFVIGGPMADCGLTGRKTMVDTYGGMARHGGGAFSGKDPSKVDRSAAYVARYIAKNIVAAKIAKRCEVHIAYAIGMQNPVAVEVETFGTSSISKSELLKLIISNFDLTPYKIIKNMNLLSPIYSKTAAYGHFGKEELPWESIDKADKLKDCCNL